MQSGGARERRLIARIVRSVVISSGGQARRGRPQGRPALGPFLSACGLCGLRQRLDALSRRVCHLYSPWRGACAREGGRTALQTGR